jgi:hypothetical protein
LARDGRIIFLGFCISFKNTSDEWNELWNGIMRYYSSKGINFDKTVFLSNMGAGEKKWIYIVKKKHFWCWCHVSDRFSDLIRENGRDYKKTLWKYVLLVYTTKTEKWRGKIVNLLDD